MGTLTARSAPGVPSVFSVLRLGLAAVVTVAAAEVDGGAVTGTVANVAVAVAAGWALTSAARRSRGSVAVLAASCRMGLAYECSLGTSLAADLAAGEAVELAVATVKR